MRVISSLLFIIGIIIALLCAAKLPAIGESWSDMLFLYGCGVTLSVLSLLPLNWSHTSKKKCASTKRTCLGSLVLLQGLLVELRHLGENINHFDEMEFAMRINALLDKYILPFTAIQQELLLMPDKNQCIKVLVHIAQSERLLNRMWSAASDGYLNEAIATYPKVLAEIEEACSTCRTRTGTTNYSLREL